MSKKKILYIHHGQGIGGAPLSLLYLIQALDTTLYEPVVLFLHHSDAMELYRSCGITILGPVGRSDFAHTSIWWYRWYHAQHFLKAVLDSFALLNGEAESWLLKIKPDIVHLNTSSLVVWGYVASKLGISVVWHIREPLAHGYFGLRRLIIKNIIAEQADAILPICKNDAKPWKNNKKTTVVYNAVPATLFSPQERKKHSAPTILFLGGLSREKGTLLLFEVFEKLLHKLPQAKLVVAGSFNLEERQMRMGVLKSLFPTAWFYQRVKEQLNKIEHAVTFVGISSRVPELMAQADCLVFPATVGHFARPIIEAGFMAKPVVASALAPMDELVIDGVTGYLVKPQDQELWVHRLYTVLTDSQVAKNLGQAAHQFATNKFSIPYQIQSVQNIYKSL